MNEKGEESMELLGKVVAPDDAVVQIKNQGGRWLDYASIKDEADCRTAEDLVKSPEYRITLRDWHEGTLQPLKYEAGKWSPMISAPLPWVDPPADPVNHLEEVEEKLLKGWTRKENRKAIDEGKMALLFCLPEEIKVGDVWVASDGWGDGYYCVHARITDPAGKEHTIKQGGSLASARTWYRLCKGGGWGLISNWPTDLEYGHSIGYRKEINRIALMTSEELRTALSKLVTGGHLDAVPWVDLKAILYPES